MKVYFTSDGKISRIPVDTAEPLFQNSGNFNYMYLYGLPEGKIVTVSYEQDDGRGIGPFQASYGYDPDSVYCVIARIPADALTLEGNLHIYVLVEYEVTEEIGGEQVTTTVRQGYASIKRRVFKNGAVVVP